MNILVLGCGGREHAITAKLNTSKHADKLYVMPGNPGTSTIAINIDKDASNNLEVLEFCLLNNIDLVIPGSEVYLQNGVADILLKHNIHVFGPTKIAAQIESSKQFAKDLMKKHAIPTAKYAVFNNYELALKYVVEVGTPIVIKYDGLAGGKGVVVAMEFEEAKTALFNMLEKKEFGNARVVIEEYLEGPEFSLMCFVDNGVVIPMPISQDHKRLLDNDLGPNTGGMGIYSPVPIIPLEVINNTIDNIMQKTVDALLAEGINYTGFLYGGIMYTSAGPKVIEFNARFGDPEAEVLMLKLESDLIEIILNLKAKRKQTIIWNKDFVLGVVLASKGYPKTYQKGYSITGLESIKDFYFHMGTSFNDKGFVTNGGRVLFVYGKGKSLLEAKEEAYSNINKIDCSNLVYRKDIGFRALEKN
ncbi:phosphoribosylamine--glycine ligase [Mycoplasmatota bacterium WC30]